MSFAIRATRSDDGMDQSQVGCDESHQLRENRWVPDYRFVRMNPHNRRGARFRTLHLSSCLIYEPQEENGSIDDCRAPGGSAGEDRHLVPNGIFLCVLCALCG